MVDLLTTRKDWSGADLYRGPEKSLNLLEIISKEMKCIVFESLDKDAEPFRQFGIKVEAIITDLRNQSLDWAALNMGFATLSKTHKAKELTNGQSRVVELTSSKANKKRSTENNSLENPSKQVKSSHPDCNICGGKTFRRM